MSLNELKIWVEALIELFQIVAITLMVTLFAVFLGYFILSKIAKLKRTIVSLNGQLVANESNRAIE